jgi:L-lactate dehydrogenase complex protein LldG
MNSKVTTREVIINKIKTALQRSDEQAHWLKDTAKIAERFQQLTQQVPVANPVNVKTSMNLAERVEHFKKMAVMTSTQVEIFSSVAQAREFLIEKIQTSTLPVYCEPSELISAMQWPKDINNKITNDYKQTGQLGIMQADCAIAETGSVVVRSGAHHPTAAGFLVDTLIVLVSLKDMLLGLEDTWPIINAKQQQQGINNLPRGVNIITGPSRTADVEQKVQLGAHGPRQLMVILIE